MTTLHELERAEGTHKAAGDYWARSRLRILREWIESTGPASLLDLGCGSGYLTAHMAGEVERVMGIDASGESIRLAGRRVTDASFAVGDALRLPVADSSFEAVVLADVLEHFEQPSTLLGECRRVLTSDGTLFVSVPAFRFLAGPHDERNDHVDRFTAGRLADVCADAGFEAEGHRYTNFFPLIPYFFLQRVLARDVPESTRGSHGRALEAIKSLLLALECRIPWPIGVTVLARFRVA